MCLAGSHIALHLLFRSDVLQLVRCREHLSRAPAHVVVKFLGHDGAGGDVVVAPVEDETHPGKLVGTSLTFQPTK